MTTRGASEGVASLLLQAKNRHWRQALWNEPVPEPSAGLSRNQAESRAEQNAW
jgi:hypothetical protein